MVKSLEVSEFTRLTEMSVKTAKIWWYRSNFEPLMKKRIVFRDNYSEARVREYIKKELGITYSFTLWPAYESEPEIIKP